MSQCRQHPAGEDIALDEIGVAPIVVKIDIVDGDDLQRRPPAGFERRKNRLEIGGPIGLTHRLKHLNRQKRVVVAATVLAVVF